MSRRAHPAALVREAVKLRKHRHGYGTIARKLRQQHGVYVGESTVRDWVTYNSRPLAAESAA